MEISGSLIINAPRNKVGDFFRDPSKVVECVPGIQNYELKGTEFKSKVKIKVGAISGNFKVEGNIKEVKPDEEYEVYMKGGSLGNKFEATAKVFLSDVEEGKTKLEYKADAKMGGVLAALGKRIIEGVSKDILSELFKCAEQKITE